MKLEVYTINNLFLLGGRTHERHPFLVIGRHFRLDPAFFSQLQSQLEGFTAPSVCSPGNLDRLLAAALKKVKPWPLLIGGTIRIPGIKARTGGVIGSPSQTAQPAGGRLEKMEDGWRLLSFSGGPGLAFKEKEYDSYYPDMKKGGGTGKEFLLSLAMQAYSAGVEDFIALTDGTGSGAAGSAVIQSGKDYMIWSLDEIEFF